VVLAPGFDFVISVLAQRLAGKSMSEMTFIVSSVSIAHQFNAQFLDEPGLSIYLMIFLPPIISKEDLWGMVLFP